MLRTLLVSLLLTIIFSGVYWYQTGASTCRYPVEYRIGEVDERFELTRDEVRLAVSDAESVWEEATGKNLFNYDPGADFAVNFIFDDRQALSKEERTAREELEALEKESASVSKRYQELVDRHTQLRQTYERTVKEYDADLVAYNDEVAQYNEQGGAPPEVYEALEATQEQLETQADSLTRQADELNQLTEQINEVGSRGNVLVEQYNERVAQYNARFGTSREFTQGDYQGDAIHIYTFADEIELRQVLVHEFGHALSLGHVDDPGAIMYRLLSTQPDKVKLTEADLAEFRRVCTESSGWSTLWPDTY